MRPIRLATSPLKAESLPVDELGEEAYSHIPPPTSDNCNDITRVSAISNIPNPKVSIDQHPLNMSRWPFEKASLEKGNLEDQIFVLGVVYSIPLHVLVMKGHYKDLFHWPPIFIAEKPT